jgi:hypothetical protein
MGIRWQQMRAFPSWIPVFGSPGAYEQRYDGHTTPFFLAGALLKAIAARLANLKPVIIRLGSTMDQPTLRELQVLRLFALGKSTKEVADELGIAFKTAAG